MKTLIVYDSYFGNTEKIAQAICDSFDKGSKAEIIKVSECKPEQLKGLDLLIVGSPTRAFRPTPPISTYLNSIPENALTGVKVAAFDTRVAPEDIKSSFLRFMVKSAGYAAKPIANLLIRKGGSLIVPPEGFSVKGNAGPLKDGEIDRAKTWIKQ